MITVLILSLPPSSNNLFSGKTRRFRSSEYEAWIVEAGYQLNRQRPPQIVGRVSILIEVAEPKTQRQMDLANREKATIDLLVKHHVIQGDSQRYLRKLTMKWADIEGVRVTISSML